MKTLCLIIISYIFFVATTMFVACTTKISENEDGSDLHEIKNIFIKTGEIKTPKLENIFKTFEYIPMETADNILLSYGVSKGTNVLYRNNQIYYADYSSIHIFDNKGKLIVHECQNDNIYEITPDSAILRYTINIDNRMAPEGFWEQEDRDWMSLREERNRKGYIDINFFSESDSSILLHYISGGSNFNNGYAFINKQSMQYILFDEIEFEPDFKWKPDFMFAQSDGQVIIPIPADLILSLPETSNLRKQFGNLKEDDNPVLFIGTII